MEKWKVAIYYGGMKTYNDKIDYDKAFFVSDDDGEPNVFGLLFGMGGGQLDDFKWKKKGDILVGYLYEPSPYSYMNRNIPVAIASQNGDSENINKEDFYPSHKYISFKENISVNNKVGFMKSFKNFWYKFFNEDVI